MLLHIVFFPFTGVVYLFLNYHEESQYLNGISRFFFPHLWSFFISPTSQGEILYCLHQPREKQMLIEQIDRWRNRWKERCQHKQSMAIHCYPQWSSYAHKCASNTNYGNKAPRGTNSVEAQAGRQAGDSSSFSARTDRAVASPLWNHSVFKGRTIHTEVYKPPPHEKCQILIQRWQYILSYQASWVSHGSQGQQAGFWLPAFIAIISQH